MTSSTAWDAIQKRLDDMPKPTQILRLCADPDVRDRYHTAKQTADRADSFLKALPKDADKDDRALVQKQVRDAQAALKAAQAEYDEHTVILTFKALETDDLQKLRAAHPATEEDEEKGLDFNFETFAPALIAAASIDGMPLEYAQHAMKTWGLTDSQSLWAAAWGVQQRRRTDLGKD